MSLPPGSPDDSSESEDDDDDDFDVPPPKSMPANRRRSIKGFMPAASIKDLLEHADESGGVMASVSHEERETKVSGAVPSSSLPSLPVSKADVEQTNTNTNSVGNSIRRRIGNLGIASNDAWFWLQHSSYAYVPARKLSGQGKQCVYETILGESVRDVNEALVSNGGDIYSNDAIPSVANLSKTYYDMVHMDDTNEASILHNVRLRFDVDLFMTNVGTILVLINPFQWFEHLYTREMIDMYHSWRLGDDALPPHVYQIGYSAYHGLTQQRENQAVIISGESGAGKTEATKKVLQYLASIASSNAASNSVAASSSSNGGSGGGGGGMESKLLSANPVLEAFGNAKTVRNNNSSRFGKWMELHFNENNWTIVGCRTVNYLLEKVRLVSQGPTERNFHTFYQFLSSSTNAKTVRSEINFTGSVNPKDYDCLYQSGGCVNVETMEENEEFDDTYNAFHTLGFTKDEIHGIYRIVASILFLGNITFDSLDDYASVDALNERSKNAAENAANSLQIDTNKMLENIAAKTLYIRGTETVKNLSPSDANDARDSMIKGLYGRLFDWIVRKVNECMGSAMSMTTLPTQGSSISHSIVGILDIFGFEIFEHNSFEQLCINFANEKLQQHFNKSTFKDEKAVYVAEEIQNIPNIQFVDNEDLISMMEKTRKPAGLLVMLDEELRLSGSGSDTNFLSKLSKVHVSSKRLRMKSVRDKNKNMKDTEFWVVHYAGDVKYDVIGFMDKNRDELFRNISEVIATSKVSLISNVLWGKDVDEDGRPKDTAPTTESKNNGRRSSTKKRMTLSGQFRRQLSSLMIKLNDAKPHYIRCIKPNASKRPRSFDANMTLEQLTYSGIFEAVEIRKQGYPFRLTHRLFFCRYAPIVHYLQKRGATNHVSNEMKSSDDRTRCTALLEYLGASDLAMNALEMGKTMILYRAPQHRWMEQLREEITSVQILFLQCSVRSFIARVYRYRLSTCKQKMLRAIQVRTSSALNSSLDDARAKGASRLYTYRRAQEILKVVEREEKVVNTLERLKNEDVEGPHFETICAALDEAKELGMEGVPIVRTCNLRINAVRVKIEVKRALVRGVEENDPDMLEKAIRDAKGIQRDLDLPSYCVNEMQAAKMKMILLEKEQEQQVKIAQVMITEEETFHQGRPTLTNPLVSESSRLKRQLQLAQEQGIATPQGISLLKRGHLLVELRPLCCLGDWSAVLHILDRKKAETFVPTKKDVTVPVSKYDAQNEVGKDELERMERAALNSTAMITYHKIITSRSIVVSTNVGIELTAVNVEKDRMEITTIDALVASRSEQDAQHMISEYTLATRRAVDHLILLREAVISNDWESVDALLQKTLNSDVRDGKCLEANEINIIKDENFRRHVVLKLTEALKSGGPGGSAAGGNTNSFPLDDVSFKNVTITGIDEGLNFASRMEDIYGEAKLLVDAASVVRRLRVGLIAIEEDTASVSSRALWNNLRHGLDIARKAGYFVKSTIASDSSLTPPLVAAQHEMMFVCDVVNDRDAQLGLLESLSRGTIPTVQQVERADSVAGAIRSAGSHLAALREAIDVTHTHFPTGPKSCLVSDLLESASFMYGLRHAFLSSDYSDLNRRVEKIFDKKDGYCESVPNMLRSISSNGPLANTLRDEINIFREHSENQLMIDALINAVGSPSPGGIASTDAPVGKLDVSMVDPKPLEEALRYCTSLSTNGGSEVRQLKEAAESMVVLRVAVLESRWEDALKECESAPSEYKQLARVSNEYERALEESEDRLIVLSCQEALISGGPSGSIGYFDISVVSTKILDATVRQSQQWTCRSDLSKRSLKTCELLRTLRTSLEMSDWIGIESVLRDARRALDSGSRGGGGLLPECLNELEFIRLEALNRKIADVLNVAIGQGSVATLSATTLLLLLSGGHSGNMSDQISTSSLDSVARDWSEDMVKTSFKLGAFVKLENSDRREFGRFPSEECQLLLRTTSVLRSARSAIRLSDSKALQHVLSEIVGISLEETMEMEENELITATATTILLQRVGISSRLMSALLPADLIDVNTSTTTKRVHSSAYDELRLLRDAWMDHTIRSLLHISITTGAAHGAVGAIIHPLMMQKDGQLRTEEGDISVNSIEAAWSVMERAECLKRRGGRGASSYTECLMTASRTIHAIRESLLDTDVGRLTRALESNDGTDILHQLMRFEEEYGSTLIATSSKTISKAASSTTSRTSTFIRNECKRAKKELYHHLNMTELCDALVSGSARGTVGHLNLNTVDVDRLDAAVSNARRRGTHTDISTMAMETAILMRRVRGALKFLDWEGLRTVLNEWDGSEWQSKWQEHGQNLQQREVSNGPRYVEIEIHGAFDELQNRDVATLLSLALSRGNVKGIPGELVLDDVATRDLDDAISMAEDVSNDDGISLETKRLLFTARVVRSVRTALVRDDRNALRRVLSRNYAVDAKRHSTLIQTSDLFDTSSSGADNSAASTSSELKEHDGYMIENEISLAEIELAVEDAHDRIIIDASTYALTEGGAGGDIGCMDLTRVTVEHLENVLRVCRDVVVPTTRDSKRNVSACREVLELRKALLDESNGTSLSNWDRVWSITSSSIVLKAGYPRIAVEELMFARDECENVRIVKRLRKVLKTHRMKEVYLNGEDIAVTQQKVKNNNKDNKDEEQQSEIHDGDYDNDSTNGDNAHDVHHEYDAQDEHEEDERSRKLDVENASVVDLETALKEIHANTSESTRRTDEAKSLLLSASILCALRANVLASDWHSVSSVIQNVRDRQLRFHSVAIKEYQAIRNESDGRVCLQVLASAVLGDGRTHHAGGIGIKGRPGHLDLNDVHSGVEECDEAISKVQQNVHIPHGRQVVKQLYEAVQLLRSLRVAVLRGDWEAAHDLVGVGVNPLKEQKITKRQLLSQVEDQNAEKSAANGSNVMNSQITTADSLVQVGFDALEDALLHTNYPLVGSTLRHEFYLVRSEVQNRMSLVSLSNAVRSGGASGKLGELDCSTVVTTELEESIAFTQAIIVQKEQEVAQFNARYQNRTQERKTKDKYSKSIATPATPAMPAILPPVGITKEAMLLLRNAELVLRIRNALLSTNWSHLERAIADAKNGAVLEFVKEEVDHARYECENRQIFQLLTKGLEKGRPIAFGTTKHVNLVRSGVLRHNEQALMDDAGLLDLETVDLTALDEGLRIAEQYGCRTKIAKDLQTVASIVRSVRECLRHVHEYDQFHGNVQHTPNMTSPCSTLHPTSPISSLYPSSDYMQAAAIANARGRSESVASPAMFGVDNHSLEHSLHEALEQRTLFDSIHWREIHDIQNDMREREVRARLSEALGNPSNAVHGDVGQLNMSHVTTSRLDSSIRFAQDIGRFFF